MRLVTYARDGKEHPGAVRGADVVDLSPLAPSLLEIIRGGDAARARAEEMAANGPAAAKLGDVALRAPIPRPSGQVYCVGWNYLKHFKEGEAMRGEKVELPDFPTFFTKAAGSVIGPGADIAYDAKITEKLDYEAELAVVIGKAGRSIPQSRALGHVFGYTLGNDVSARDVQRRHGGQWIKGKSMDTYCPLGPVLVTADEIPDPQKLSMRLTVNGELRQESPLDLMVFPVARLIAELSLGMTLNPGDILLTGTPEGVGMGRDPQVWLTPGDVIAITIEEIGTLTNRVTEIRLT